MKGSGNGEDAALGVCACRAGVPPGTGRERGTQPGGDRATVRSQRSTGRVRLGPEPWEMGSVSGAPHVPTPFTGGYPRSGPGARLCRRLRPDPQPRSSRSAVATGGTPPTLPLLPATRVTGSAARSCRHFAPQPLAVPRVGTNGESSAGAGTCAGVRRESWVQQVQRAAAHLPAAGCCSSAHLSAAPSPLQKWQTLLTAVNVVSCLSSFQRPYELLCACSLRSTTSVPGKERILVSHAPTGS